MSMTLDQARDEMTAVFWDVWEATTHPVAWQDEAFEPPAASSWARFTIRHELGRNKAIGNKSFLRQGNIFIQIFVPVGDGLSASDDLAKIVAGAYEGTSTPGGAWFRNVTAREIGRDGNWTQFQVRVDFEWTEIKG